MHLKIKRIRELFGYAIALTKEQGLFGMLGRGAGFFRRRFFGKKARYLPTKQVLAAQRDETAAEGYAAQYPVISVLTPLYNTPPKMLRDFLDSLRNQTAPNWQLCLADASDDAHAEVGQIVAEYMAKDARFAYCKIANDGISQNTNAAAALAKGEYLALADHDDILAPHAIYTVTKAIAHARENGTEDGFFYSDEALFAKSIQRPMVGHFKPDFALDYLLCCNYICHLAVFKKSIFDAIGGERKECDGSQDFDLFLRILAHTKTAVHIPEVLYYWRVHAASTSGGVAAKPYVAAAAKKALADYLVATGQQGEVCDGLFPSTYRVKWEIEGTPKVSILIPNKDHTDDLETCLASIYKETTWQNFEVIVIENNSTDPVTFDYYKQAEERYPNLQVVQYQAEGGFNFSAINNFGRAAASGDYLLLLNNDVEVMPGDGDWLAEMLRQLARKEGGALCGAMLYYPDGTLQHAGVITGLGGYAGHSHKYAKQGGSGYMFRAATVQNFSAVTAACLLVQAEVYDALGGLDEAFTVAFNDVDFCLRARDAGHRIIWTPYAKLTHYESKSRGLDEKDAAKKARFDGERARLYAQHTRAGILADPYYNPSLTKDREDFSESDDLRNLKNP
ncbi:MAG: glycosyltransferase family 2 protein [Faecalibacterium sp.]